MPPTRPRARTRAGRHTPPAFLVGCHRSGTTLARYLLDAHPRIACPPESKFIAGLEAFLEYPQVKPALDSLGCGEEQIRRELRKLIVSVLGAYARRQGKARWIDKTPNYYRLLPFIDGLFGGEALYLFLVRHPLDCAGSLLSVYGDRDEFPDPEIARSIRQNGNTLRGWVKYWNEVYGRISAFAAAHPGRCHVFRYEDLVYEPEPTLARALDFLGEKLPPDLVTAALNRSHTPGYEDPGIRGRSRIGPESIGKWRDWPGTQISGLWRLAQPVASQFGYESQLAFSELHRSGEIHGIPRRS